jgi:hypothetical protein
MKRLYRKASFLRIGAALGMTLLLAPLFAPLYAQEAGGAAARTVDMRIIVDASRSLARGKAGAVNWLCDTIVDRTLQSGDTLYLVASKEADEVIFDGVIGDDAQKEALKEKIRALEEPSGESHAARTVRNVFAGIPARAGGIPVTIIVCGTGVTIDGNLLRYSRTENFAYWRAVTTAEHLEARVNRALKKALP